MAILKDAKKQLDKKAYFAAKEIREKWGLSKYPILDIFSLVESKDFLLLRFPNSNKISGVYIEKQGRIENYKCIYVNTLDPYGRQNFTLAHELYHVFFEKSSDAVCLESKRSQDPIEFTAERFASHFLIPVETLIEYLSANKINSQKAISFKMIVYLQSIFKVSFLAMVYSIERLGEYEKCAKYVPINIKGFYKFRHENRWEELEKKTLECDGDIKLNKSEPIFYMPVNFKNNLIKNIEIGNVEIDEAREIFHFFNEKLC